VAGGNFFKPPVGDAQANFRYGLACGAEAERERIIALLESISFLEDYPPFNHTIVTKEAIALIKGEKE
jgi:hypothetical protein